MGDAVVADAAGEVPGEVDVADAFEEGGRAKVGEGSRMTTLKGSRWIMVASSSGCCLLFAKSQEAGCFSCDVSLRSVC